MEIVTRHPRLSEDTQNRSAATVADYKAASKLLGHLELMPRPLTLADAKVAFQAAHAEWWATFGRRAR